MNSTMIRARARESLQGNWASSIAVAAIAALLGAMIAGSTFIPQISTEVDSETLHNMNRFLREFIRSGDFRIGFNSGIFSVVQFILGGTIQLGFARFLLSQHDGKERSWEDLFSQFHRFGQGFAQKFLRGLYIALWGLLFVIPGIVKSLSYAMTPYIMAEQPELSASEAIQRSMLMMDGHKWELFLLHLSFIGWDLLVALTAGIGNLVLNPYKNAAITAFYRELKQEHPYV